MTVERMTKDLAVKVSEIEKECFSSPWSLVNLLSETENPTAVFLVAIENGEALGYIGANNILGEVFITNLAVKKAFRRNNIGSRLLSSLIEECKNQGADYITLEVRESNIPAISLYEKTGFRKVGVRKNFYSEPDENALLYTLDFDYD